MINQMRAFLLETWHKGSARRPATLRGQMPEILEDADEKLSSAMRRLLDCLWQEWEGPQLQIESLNTQLEQIASSDPSCVRLQQIPGVGPLVSSCRHIGHRERRGLQKGTGVCGLAGTGDHGNGRPEARPNCWASVNAWKSLSAQNVHPWSACCGLTRQTRRLQSDCFRSDLLRHLFHRAHYFWRNFASEIELSCFDPEYPQALRKSVKNASQLYGFRHAVSVSRYGYAPLCRHLATVPKPHLANGCPCHDRVHEDYVIAPTPCLDKSQGFARADLSLHAQFPHTLRDHDSGAVIASIAIPQPMTSMVQSTPVSSRSTTTFSQWVAQEMHGS